MQTIDLNEWPQFRKDSVELANNLTTLVSVLDGVMDSDISEADKEAKTSELLETYLPQ
jgi:hypothetical protein